MPHAVIAAGLLRAARAAADAEARARAAEHARTRADTASPAAAARVPFRVKRGNKWPLSIGRAKQFLSMMVSR
jgi:hypothetical protein